MHHRIADFRCRSSRVTGFFEKEWLQFRPRNYCRVFILPNPADPTEVWGYYTLAPSLVEPILMTGSDQNRVPSAYTVPMVRIGFMGRHETALKGLGRGLIIDAARRVHRSEELSGWGLMLESEGGPDTTLWEWYLAQGFSPAATKEERRAGNFTNVMYGGLKKFLPELQP